MEKKIRQKVRYEFFKFAGDALLISKQYSLKLENPCEITFLCQCPIGSSGFATINNAYNIQSYNDSINPVLSVAPYQINFKTNQNEVDITNYSLIVFGADTIVTITCKYYVNE
jgi:hypothetical protein